MLGDVITILSPQDPSETNLVPLQVAPDEILKVITEEALAAAKKITKNKVPGLNVIPNRAVLAPIKIATNWFTVCLKDGVYPEESGSYIDRWTILRLIDQYAR